MRRVLWIAAAALLPACSCSSKPHVAKTSGIVVLSIDGHDTTESDASLPFPETCVAAADVAPVSKSFEIKNSGQSPLAVSKVALSGVNAASFQITSTLPTSIDGLGSAEVVVQFAPTAAGNQSASIEIDTDDPNKATVNVRLTGVGSVKAHDATYDSSCTDQNGDSSGTDACQFLTFADTGAGTTVTKAVTITNIGCPPLQLTGADIVNSGFPDGGSAFHVHAGGPTAAAPVTVNTGDSYDLQIDFAPGADDFYVGDLYVTTNGHPDSQQSHAGVLPDGGALPDAIFYVGLSGQGTQAQVTLLPVACDFTDTSANSPCGAHADGGDVFGTFTVRNDGHSSIDVTAVAISGDGGAAFSVVPATLPATLATQGDSFAVTVVYDPAQVATGAANLTVTTSAGTLSASLIGETHTIAVPGNTVSFNGGTTDPAQFASPQPVAITASGNGPIHVSGITFSLPADDGGTAPCDGFSLDASTAPSATPPFDLAAQATATLKIAYAPGNSRGGLRDCELHVANTSTNAPDALVQLEADTYVNCDPTAALVAVGDGGFPNGAATVVDGSGSLDPGDADGCTGGQSQGIGAWHWTLTAANAGANSNTHLAADPSVAACNGTNDPCFTCSGAGSLDGGCLDLTVSTASPFTVGASAKTVQVVANEPAGGHPYDLSLSVVDGSGRASTAADTIPVVVP